MTRATKTHAAGVNGTLCGLDRRYVAFMLAESDFLVTCQLCERQICRAAERAEYQRRQTDARLRREYAAKTRARARG